MTRLLVSPQAEQDAAAIITMLKDKAGAIVTARCRREFDALLERLIVHPRNGPRRPTLGDHARIGVIAPYIVIYDFQDDDVVVLRILDGRRDITRRLVRE